MVPQRLSDPCGYPSKMRWTMQVPPLSKTVTAIAIYLLGAAMAGAVLRTEWTGVAVLGLDLVLYGVYLSTVKGRRDWGDALVWLAVALVLGVGCALMARKPEPTGLDPTGAAALIRGGHLWGIGIFVLGWWPLRSQGAVPGGPVKD